MENAGHAGVHLLENGIVGRRQYSSQLFHQVWSIARLLQLLDDTDDNIIIDSFRVNFLVIRCSGRRRWRVFISGPAAAFWSLGEGD